MSDTIIKRSIEYLNSVTGAEFSPDFPDTVETIRALVDLGYGLDDMRHVIDKKWRQWKGTKFENYMRPSTLFGRNFESYLNEQRNTKGNPIEQLSGAVERAKQANWRLDNKRG